MYYKEGNEIEKGKEPIKDVVSNKVESYGLMLRAKVG